MDEFHPRLGSYSFELLKEDIEELRESQERIEKMLAILVPESEIAH